MSFRLVDLKKSVRKTKNGYVVAPQRLEGRAAAYRIEFVLQQLELHRNQPRKTLDPAALLEFLGDARLGRGILAALTQWYRTRPRSFAEFLGASPGQPAAPHGWAAQLTGAGIGGPVALRSWLFQEINQHGNGFLDPAECHSFWRRQEENLGVGQSQISRLICLDHPDEAILVRTAPRPTAEDVMAAYNARAFTTLLRSARCVILQSSAKAKTLERLAAAVAAPLGVEWSAAAGGLSLSGRADALGCWTRHGRRVERAVLELIRQRDLQVTGMAGEIDISGRQCRFQCKPETLGELGAGSEVVLPPDISGDLLMRRLREERRCSGEDRWTFRRAGCVARVSGGSFVPQVEAACGDFRVLLRSGLSSPGAEFAAFAGKTPVALVEFAADNRLILQVPGLAPVTPAPGRLLAALLEPLLDAGNAPSPGAEGLPAAA